MSKVCVLPRSTDQWIRRRVYSPQTSQPYASASGCMRVCAQIAYHPASLPSLNTIINSFSSCSLLAPCAHVWDTLHTRPPMTFLEVTYAISKPRPPHNLSRTHVPAYSSRGHPTLSAGRDPWVLPRLCPPPPDRASSRHCLGLPPRNAREPSGILKIRPFLPQCGRRAQHPLRSGQWVPRNVPGFPSLPPILRWRNVHGLTPNPRNARRERGPESPRSLEPRPVD